MKWLVVTSLIFGLCVGSCLIFLAPDRVPEKSDGVLQHGKMVLNSLAKLEEAEIYRDGGSLQFLFVDSSGEAFAFWLKGPKDAENPRAVRILVKFDPNRDPAEQEEHVVPRGSDEEKAVVGCLQEWVNKNVPSDKLNRLSAINRLQDHDAWQKEFMALSEIDQRICRLTAAVSELTERCPTKMSR